jgi:hypothetical protein
MLSFLAERNMTLGQFLGKQFCAVIEWNEPADGILSYCYPMHDLEIENGGQLIVSESQMAAFVNEGKIADVFGPGLHTLNTRNLPLLTDLMNWDKAFESPFKPEVYVSRRACRSTRSGARPLPSPPATRSLARSGCAVTAYIPTASMIRESSSARSAVPAIVTSPLTMPSSDGHAGPGNVVIDSCEDCCLIWMDSGELMRIARATDVPNSSNSEWE